MYSKTLGQWEVSIDLARLVRVNKNNVVDLLIVHPYTSEGIFQNRRFTANTAYCAGRGRQSMTSGGPNGAHNKVLLSPSEGFPNTVDETESLVLVESRQFVCTCPGMLPSLGVPSADTPVNSISVESVE